MIDGMNMIALRKPVTFFPLPCWQSWGYDQVPLIYLSKFCFELLQKHTTSCRVLERQRSQKLCSSQRSSSAPNMLGWANGPVPKDLTCSPTSPPWHGFTLLMYKLLKPHAAHRLHYLSQGCAKPTFHLQSHILNICKMLLPGYGSEYQQQMGNSRISIENPPFSSQ